MRGSLLTCSEGGVRGGQAKLTWLRRSVSPARSSKRNNATGSAPRVRRRMSYDNAMVGVHSGKMEEIYHDRVPARHARRADDAVFLRAAAAVERSLEVCPTTDT